MKQGNLSETVIARMDPQLRGTLAALARMEQVTVSEAIRRAVSLAGDFCGCSAGGAGGGQQGEVEHGDGQ